MSDLGYLPNACLREAERRRRVTCPHLIERRHLVILRSPLLVGLGWRLIETIEDG